MRFRYKDFVSMVLLPFSCGTTRRGIDAKRGSETPFQTEQGSGRAKLRSWIVGNLWRVTRR